MIGMATADESERKPIIEVALAWLATLRCGPTSCPRRR